LERGVLVNWPFAAYSAGKDNRSIDRGALAEVEAMNQGTKRLLYWTPRILCLLFAAFLSIFALDVFSEDYSFWETVVALIMHLVPTFVVLIVLAISWRWEWVGAVIFSTLGVLYIVMAWGRFPLSVYFVISGPLFVVAGLFLANWILRGRLRPSA
jgi:hypothetical protein